MGERKKRNGAKPSRAKAAPETAAAPLRDLPAECYDPYPLFDDEDWLPLMDPAFCDNHDLAVRFARLLLKIKRAIESGPEGGKRASFTLIDGIRMAYKYTEEHQLAFRLFILYLEGRLKAEDEPLRLLKAAIARADPE